MTFELTFFMVLISFVFVPQSFAHKGHHHGHDEHHSETVSLGEQQKKPLMGLIGESYAKNVQPIFSRKCMDCHSAQTRYPWYYRIPGVKYFIDQDINEAREHLDFTQGFPFKSHASPEEDLLAIQDSIQNGTMPPFSYRLFHPGSEFSDEEKKVVLDWIEQSKTMLKK